MTQNPSTPGTSPVITTGSGSGTPYSIPPPPPGGHPNVGIGAGAVKATAAASDPRVGGISAQTPWVGGSNLSTKKPTAPYDVLCYRPADFRSMQKQHELLKAGLPESRRLELTDMNKETSVSLMTWLEELKLMLETKGLDTVFRVVKDGIEIYMLAQWGDLNLTVVPNGCCGSKPMAISSTSKGHRQPTTQLENLFDCLTSKPFN